MTRSDYGALAITSLSAAATFCWGAVAIEIFRIDVPRGASLAAMALGSGVLCLLISRRVVSLLLAAALFGAAVGLAVGVLVEPVAVPAIGGLR